MTNILPTKSTESVRFIRRLQKEYGVSESRVILVGATATQEFTELGEGHISLKSLYSWHIADQSAMVIPQDHRYSRFHYEIVYHRYIGIIPYNEYCLLEEQLADVLRQFILDTRNNNYLVVVSDDAWLHDESLVSYFRPSEKRILRVLQEDLDALGPGDAMKKPHFVDRVVFFWDLFSRPVR